MKVIQGLLVLLAVVCPISGQRSSNQSVVTYCTKIKESNQLKFEFRMDLGLDPVGDVAALDATTRALISPSTCSIVYDAANKVYTFTSLISLSTTGLSGNGCGFSVGFTNTHQLFTWKVAYYEFPSHRDFSAGLNREYTTVCNMSEVKDNTRDASFSVSAPNLNQNVVVQVPSISLHIRYESSPGVYSLATNNTAVVTDQFLKLELRLNHGGFDQNKIFGVAGRRTEVGGNDFINNVVEFLDANGCPTSFEFAPANGFTSSSTQTNEDFVSLTGAFRAWKFDNSDYLRFRVTFVPCRAPTYNTLPLCLNTCSALSKRRRRDAEDGEVDIQSAVASIRIYNPSANQHDPQTSDDTTMIYVGTGVAVGVSIILLAIVVCIVSRRSRRLREDKKSTKVEEFRNNLHY